MEGDKAPAKRPRPWDTRQEPEHPDCNGAADHQVHNHRFELAGDPGRPIPAPLGDQKQIRRCARDDKSTRNDGKIHAFMITRTNTPGLPFDPLDVPFGESRLCLGNPTADVA